MDETNDEEFWEDLSESEDESPSPSLPQPPEPSSNSFQQKTLVLWLVGFILRFQARFNVPESAISRLVSFLHVFFSVLGQFSPVIAGLAHQFPTSLYCLRKMVNSDSEFTKYIVCPRCENIYHRGSCSRRTGTREEIVNCNYSEFSNKTYPVHTNQQCGQQLLKTVHLRSGKTIFYPFKIYCYRSIQSYLEQFLLEPSFIDSCNQWKNRHTSNGLFDIYDGNIGRNL